jgi:hypothetical protein
MKRVLAISLLATLLLSAGTGATPAQAVTNDYSAAATQGMKGTGNYTSNADLIARLVKNPQAPAYVFFRLSFASPTCAGAKYTVIAFDANTGARAGAAEDRGPGTFSAGLGLYVIEFQIPVPQFDPSAMTPAAVCVTDAVLINDTVVHQGPSIGENGCTFPGLFLQLNPTGGGGGEFDM